MTKSIFTMAAFVCLGVTARAQSITLELHEIRTGIQTVNVSVNGKTVTMLLDTGSSNTILSPNLTTALNDNNVHGVNLSGSYQMRRAMPVRIDVGSHPFLVNTAMLSDMPSSVPFQGIIGMDVLSHFSSISFDLKAHTVTLTK